MVRIRVPSALRPCVCLLGTPEEGGRPQALVPGLAFVPRGPGCGRGATACRVGTASAARAARGSWERPRHEESALSSAGPGPPVRSAWGRAGAVGLPLPGRAPPPFTTWFRPVRGQCFIKGTDSSSLAPLRLRFLAKSFPSSCARSPGKCTSILNCQFSEH